MATVNIEIRRDNGTYVTGSATIDDALLLDITSMLGAMVFDASSTPVVAPTTTTTP